MGNNRSFLTPRWKTRFTSLNKTSGPETEKSNYQFSNFDQQDDIISTRTTSKSQAKPKVILVMNSKGGSGKTTLSTNLSTLLAAEKSTNRVVLVDHDIQGSSTKWLKTRSPRHRHIDGIFPARDNIIKFKRTWRLQVNPNATHVIIDSPAGLTSFELSDRIRESNIIIIPVMPSSIDINATADFVSKIFVNPTYLNSNKAMAVVANGVNKELHNFEKLQRFLSTLKIPFISQFTDHKSYIVAAENGCGINELPRSHLSQKDWSKIFVLDFLAGYYIVYE